MINKILYNYSNNNTVITTSNLPSTTIDSIKVKVNEDLTLIDTPGLLDNEDIIEFIDKSNEIVKEKIINQVLNIDFEELKALYEKTFEDIYVDLEELQPIAGVNPDRLTKEELENYEKAGSDIIKNNK